MDAFKLYEKFRENFDVVGIIPTEAYLREAKKMGKEVPDETYQTMVVLGLSYPFRFIKHTSTHLVPSFYTFGSDYHVILKNRIKHAMESLPYNYRMGVDNHKHHERLAATIAGLGYVGKNQLLINRDYGSYLFLGVVFIDVDIEQSVKLEVDDSCGDCTMCQTACPTQALTTDKIDITKCISYYNQEKMIMSDQMIDKNYSLFGCDICQMVCPKNINIKKITHPEFELSGKEMVGIFDLFELSEKAFRAKYSNMAYLWKGKTILMRNALMVLVKKGKKEHLDLVKKSLNQKRPEWYNDLAKRVIEAWEADQQ